MTVQSEISVGKRRLSPHLDASRIFRIGVNGSSLSSPAPAHQPSIHAALLSARILFLPSRGFALPTDFARTFVMDDVDMAAAVLHSEPRGRIRILCAQKCGPATCVPRRAEKPRVRDARRSRVLADLAGPLNLDWIVPGALSHFYIRFEITLVQSFWNLS